MNIKQKAIEHLSSLFKESLIEARAEKFLEAIVTTPLKESDRVEVEKSLRDAGFHVAMLGVSGVEKGYRIWGYLFQNENELTDYLNNAHKGHKELGAQMELFTFKEQSPGSTFWLSQGVELRKQMQNYLLKKLGPSYLEVKTPQLLKKSLWEQSGHLAAFAENMFFVDDEHGLKPMNCPCHMLIFKEKIRSYKDLPYRIYEYGEVFRNEASGALNGLLRVRNMTIDDGHIFCTIDQIKDEVEAFMQIIKNVYSEFGFNKVSVYLSTRPENYQGDSEVWNKSESMLRELQLEEKPGEGAFYGPKVEFHLEDSLGRMWQCGTIQLDFILPERMGLKYTASSGEQQTPVVLHRAIFGTLERFTAILLESYQGWLPAFIAPTQLMIIPAQSDLYEEAVKIQDDLPGIRVIIGDASIGKSLHRAQQLRVPFAWIVGKKELEAKSITVKCMQNNEQSTVLYQDAKSALYKNCS